MLVFMFCRLGEARNPGPFEEFTIGAANPAGLLHRAPCLLELPRGVWHLSETQLSEVGVSTFRQSLGACSNSVGRSLRCVPGHPVPTRSHDSDAGSWSGVMIVADSPLREVQVPWRGHEHSSSRVVVASSFFGQMQITSAAAYGAPKSPSFRNPLKITEDILLTLTEEIIDGSHGPRVIAGDLNLDLSESSLFQYWESCGWKELQQFAYERWGQEISMTCKSTTRRDYVWVSPELLPLLCEVKLDHQMFPDHSVLWGVFQMPTTAPSQSFWPMAHALPWAEIPIQDWHTAAADWIPETWEDDMNTCFARWSNRVEESLRVHAVDPIGLNLTGCFGRGQALQPQIRREHPHRLRAHRPGEEAMTSSLLGQQVHWWYKQLRRLQALLHGLRSGRNEPHVKLHNAQLWQSILRARGFKHGFSKWWFSRRVRLQASPASLPRVVPTCQWLEIIFEDYRQNYRSFEAWQSKKRATVLSARRESSLKMLRRSLKPDPLPSMDYLEKSHTFTVQDIDANSGSVSFSPPLTSSKGTFTLQNEPVQLLGILDDDDHEASLESNSTTWHIVSDVIPVPGQTLIQKFPLVHCDEIHCELESLWHPRWNHQVEVTSEPWSRIFAFARDFLPTLPLVDCEVNTDCIAKTLRSGKGLRTRGPDGWSADDLRHLPHEHLEDLSSMFSVIEAGAPWPMQLVTGHVTALAKHENAVEAASFRPVVLYSLLYRLWSSAKSRCLLAQFARFMDFACFGFLKKRQCLDITYWIQCAVETSYASDQELCGIMTDIRRCFNYLPRAPIFMVARVLGVPDTLLCGWQSFLDLNTRSFRVRHQYGTALSSTSGFPEGDALSCLAMTLTSWTLHFYLWHFEPNIHCLSFVDNIELLGHQPAELLQGYLRLESWADMLQLSFDVEKTQAWATSPSLRRELGYLGFEVCEGAADLGASMIYGSRLRNKHFTDRIRAMHSQFMALKRLRVSMWHKLLALRISLWPRALHNASHLVFGHTWIRQLRTSAMQALRANRAGTSPVLYLGFVGAPECDPGFFAAWRAFSTFVQQLRQHETLRDWWACYVLEVPKKATYGPFALIQKYCTLLNWSIDHELVLHHIEGFSLDICACEMEAFRMVFEHSWFNHLMSEVCARQEYQGLRTIDPGLSYHCLGKLPSGDHELLMCIRSGTFFLESQKHKFDALNDGVCRFCGLTDTLRHRALTCPHSQSVRSEFSWCVEQWDLLPPFLTHHGLAPCNPHLLRYWDRLQHLPAAPSKWQIAPVADEWVHIFTDGSLWHGWDPRLALASYACILGNTGETIQSGLLPGLLQTINRAEMFAVIQALRWCVRFGITCWLWTDSAYVHDHLVDFLTQRAFPDDISNRDLWFEVEELLWRLPHPPRVSKVRAHQSWADAADVTEEWIIRCNALADVNA